MKQNSAKIIIGVAIILVGISLILRNAGVEFNLFFTGWWAVLMMIIAIISMTSGEIGPGNFALLIIGAWLFADQRDWIPQWFNSAYLIGAGIIGFGLLFIFNPRKEYRSNNTDQDTRREQPRQKQEDTRKEKHSYSRSNETNPSYTAIFSGQDIRNSSSNFDGANLFALFGGLSLDLRDAIITHDIIVDATAIFGGVDIKLPSDVQVIVKATPLFGGVDDKSRKISSLHAPTVTVRCLAAFGGVDIM